jgi:hypothetical protein
VDAQPTDPSVLMQHVGTKWTPDPFFPLGYASKTIPSDQSSDCCYPRRSDRFAEPVDGVAQVSRTRKKERAQIGKPEGTLVRSVVPGCGIVAEKGASSREQIGDSLKRSTQSFDASRGRGIMK